MISLGIEQTINRISLNLFRKFTFCKRHYHKGVLTLPFPNTLAPTHSHFRSIISHKPLPLNVLGSSKLFSLRLRSPLQQKTVSIMDQTCGGCPSLPPPPPQCQAYNREDLFSYSQHVALLVGYIRIIK